MPRGTRKRNFKKKKTRNNKKLRNTRRTRRKRGGFPCVSLSLGSQKDQAVKTELNKIDRCLEDTDDIKEEWIKIYLAAKGLRPRGGPITSFFKRKHTQDEIKDANQIWDAAVKQKNDLDKRLQIQRSNNRQKLGKKITGEEAAAKARRRRRQQQYKEELDRRYKKDIQQDKYQNKTFEEWLEAKREEAARARAAEADAVQLDQWRSRSRVHTLSGDNDDSGFVHGNLGDDGKRGLGY